MQEKVKEPVIAGTWYPQNPNELTDLLQSFLRTAPDTPVEGLRALISPHAGYMFSGQVAAYGYRCLKNEASKFNQVILMAPSHRTPLNGVSIGNFTHFRTPLGKVPVSKKAAALASECRVVSPVETPFEEEHALEIQLPFLQTVLEDFTLIPLICGRMDGDQIHSLSAALSEHLDENTLLVVSTDLSHFHPYDTAASRDGDAIDSILSLDFNKASEQEMCGVFPVLTSLLMARDKGWKPKLLKYATSAEITGDKTSVVGYASIVFQENSAA